MQLKRNQTTRSLWDRNYTDPSWIAAKVYLIPHMKDWLAAGYPGLKTGITEYNWGAENHINGATTQADIYGIFGREGLDMAARWTTPANTTPTYKAMKMYRNYDGNKSGFGDTSVAATVPNPDNLSAFAAQRASDGALTVMVIGKISGTTPVTLNLANFQAAGTAQRWQLTSTNTITRLADVSFSGSTLSTSVPGQSITLFVIAGGGGGGGQTPNVPPTAQASGVPTSGPAPLPVAFTAAGSSDSDGSIASYAWNFGDGGTGSGLTASHTYANAGSYTATLTVTDNDGATATKTVAITATSALPNVSPTAVAAATPASGAAPLPVSFSAAGSVDPDGSIGSYAWNFGDGSTGAGLTTSHTYGSAGTYTATLTVTDNRGATATKTVKITVASNPNLIFAPTDLLGSVSRGGNVTLGWKDNSDNETGFSIERAVSGSSSYAIVGTAFANAPSFSQSGVAKGKYVYRVRAVDDTTGAASAYSNLAYINVTR
jgi:PKD repeat protein